ncbi:MAG: hypothetical protein QW290_09065 [Sulfolobales archaeon]
MIVGSDAGVFKESVFNYASISLALGIPGFAFVPSATFSSKIDSVVEEMLNHVRV